MTVGSRTCPKCGFSQPDDNAECAQCGVVFERYHQQRDALLKRTSARTGDPPRAIKRVRPLTILMLLIFFAVAWLLIRDMEAFNAPPAAWSGDEGVSAGGTIKVAKRGRVEAAASDDDAEPWEGELAFGVRVYPEALPTADAAEGGEATWSLQYQSADALDDVMTFYREQFGNSRLFREPLEVPEAHANAAMLAGVTRRYARWFATTTDENGQAMNVDVVVESPYLQADGTFHPDATIVTITRQN